VSAEEEDFDLGTSVLAMPGSDRIPDAISAMPEVIQRMVARRPADGDPGIVTITEAFEGPVFTVWREGRMVCSSNSWLAAAPEARRRLAALLPSEDIELVIGHPRDYWRFSPDKDLFLLELRVGGQRRSWEEMAAASKLVPDLHLEHVIRRDRAGISIAEAIRSVGMAGSMSYKRDPRRLIYWLDIGEGPTAKNAALAMYLAPLPKMSYQEMRFFRSFRIFPRFNEAAPANDTSTAVERKPGSAPDQLGRMEEDLSKLTPNQRRKAAMKAAQTHLLGV
jgi:hypothetical protein